MNDLIGRIAFAIQEDGMTRLEAQRIARTVLISLASGDRIGKGLVVERQTSPACFLDIQVAAK